MLQASPAVRRSRRDTFGDGSPADRRPVRTLAVLCVDDHRGYLAGVKRWFERAGWLVVTAIDGRSALAQARRQTFDVLLVDLRLPDVSGIEVVRKLRLRGVATPGVILTAFPDGKSAVAAANLGLDYLLKTEAYGPALVERVRKVAESPRLGRDGAAALLQQLHQISSVLASSSSDCHDRRRHCVSLVEVAMAPDVSLAEFLTSAEAVRILSNEQTKPKWAAQFLRRLTERLPERERISCELDLESAARFNVATVQTERRVSVMEDADLEPLVRSRLGWSARLVRLAGVMRRAALELAFTDEQVAQIGYRLGYQYHSVFDRDFRAVFGASPRAFRTVLRS